MHISQSYIMHSKEAVHRDINRLVIILHLLPSSSVTCEPQVRYVMQFHLT